MKVFITFLLVLVITNAISPTPSGNYNIIKLQTIIPLKETGVVNFGQSKIASFNFSTSSINFNCSYIYNENLEQLSIYNCKPSVIAKTNVIAAQLGLSLFTTIVGFKLNSGTPVSYNYNRSTFSGKYLYKFEEKK